MNCAMNSSRCFRVIGDRTAPLSQRLMAFQSAIGS
jgi:hypothetical protein